MTQYQTFGSLKGASRSEEKLAALHLPKLAGKSFLDVGCNEGFFCGIASAAGAAHVVGIDRDGKYIAKARERFPEIEFRIQSWNQPIEGHYDVILIASAIHYADDQPGLIHKLVSLLKPGGVLVVELGMSPDAGDNYVKVKRTAGDVREYATQRAIAKYLADLSYRVIGPSVDQAGDPVPRFVLHIRKLQPIIVMFDAPSMSGKSSAVQIWSRARDRNCKDVRAVSLDGILNSTNPDLIERFPEHAEIIGRLSAFKREVSPFADKIMEMLAAEGKLEQFMQYQFAFFNLAAMRFVIWDGYLPPSCAELARVYFEKRGWVVWDTHPRRHFREEWLNSKAALAALPERRQNSKIAAAPPEKMQIRGRLTKIIVSPNAIRLIGWAADRLTRSAAGRFAVRVDGKLVEQFSVTRIQRAKRDGRPRSSSAIMDGFKLELNVSALASSPEEWLKFLASGRLDTLQVLVGSRGAGTLHALERKPDLKPSWR